MSLIGDLEPSQVTLNILRVARLFSSRPERPRCGWDVARSLEIPHSTSYNILRRLEKLQWLNGMQEPQRLNGEPGRHLYRITSFGLSAARQAFLQLEIYST